MANFLSDPNTMLILAFLVGITFANMLSKNLIATLVQVKLFKRGNVAVCVAHDLEDYYVPGKFDAGCLEFTARKRGDNPRAKRIMSLDKEVTDKAFYKSFNTSCIMIDDVKNSIFIRKNGSYESTGGFNAEALSEKIDTALKKPPEDETGLMPPKNFQLLVLGGIIVLGIGGYFIYKTLMKHDGNTKQIYDLVVALQNNLNATCGNNKLPIPM